MVSFFLSKSRVANFPYTLRQKKPISLTKLAYFHIIMINLKQIYAPSGFKCQTSLVMYKKTLEGVTTYIVYETLDQFNLINAYYLSVGCSSNSAFL